MVKLNIFLFVLFSVLVTGCSIKNKHQNDANGCVIKLDTPEGTLPGKIEQATGNANECKAIEKAIDKAI